MGQGEGISCTKPVGHNPATPSLLIAVSQGKGQCLKSSHIRIGHHEIPHQAGQLNIATDELA